MQYLHTENSQFEQNIILGMREVGMLGMCSVRVSEVQEYTTS